MNKTKPQVKSLFLAARFKNRRDPFLQRIWEKSYSHDKRSCSAGSIVTAIVVFDQRRSIYSSISGTKPESVAQYRRIEPLFGRKSCSELAHLWNKAVDETFRPVPLLHPDGRFI